jgi:2-methylcitrate dehydratase PrpD
MATQAEQLAQFAAALQFDDIPAEVVARVQLHLLDILGIGLARVADIIATVAHREELPRVIALMRLCVAA